MTTDSLYQIARLCNHIEDMGLDEIDRKLQQDFSARTSDKLFQHIKRSHCNQAVFFDEEKDYTLCNIYKYFQPNQNLWQYDHSNQILHTTVKSTAKTINLYEPFANHPELERLPKSHLITTHDDDGLQQDKRGNTFLSDAQAKHYYVNIDDILEHFDDWFTTNLFRKIHDNILPIPLGVSNDGNYTKHKIDDIRRSSVKNKLCGCRMAITSLYRERVALWAHKTEWIDDFIIPRTDLLDYHARTNHNDIFVPCVAHNNYINELASYRYSICPQGNGLDTHRLYECIMCNTVPIVQYNYANYIFSKIWPMILVAQYEDEEALKQKIKDFENKNTHVEYDYELLLRNNVDQLMERIKYECQRS